ncbi:hypothetical protein ZIOFF_007681 [Zingiber officinale]|uniref:50S ribosomal protein L34 n=1 Tax=Zingiber officinale TaxID=94328 RepID=A0A8J5M5Z4_ZINOF|nr:hypothetical protein ZIOFF_007681 [Zingiber officinale]
MSSKTLARAGASLFSRLFVANSSKQICVPLLPDLPPILRSSCSPANLVAAFPPPSTGRNGGVNGTQNILASSQEMLFPCGLPSLRFFIDEGIDDGTKEPMQLLPKRTYQPSHIKRKRAHGYRARSLSLSLDTLMIYFFLQQSTPNTLHSYV